MMRQCALTHSAQHVASRSVNLDLNNLAQRAVFDDEQSAVISYFPNREIKRFDILSFLEQQKKPE